MSASHNCESRSESDDAAGALGEHGSGPQAGKGAEYDACYPPLHVIRRVRRHDFQGISKPKPARPFRESALADGPRAGQEI